MGKRVCGTCGHGATSKLLDNLKDTPAKVYKGVLPKNKSKQEKIRMLAQAIVKRMTSDR